MYLLFSVFYPYSLQPLSKQFSLSIQSSIMIYYPSNCIPQLPFAMITSESESCAHVLTRQRDPRAFSKVRGTTT